MILYPNCIRGGKLAPRLGELQGAPAPCTVACDVACLCTTVAPETKLTELLFSASSLFEFILNQERDGMLNESRSIEIFFHKC